jgi:hypothetical protein
MDFQGLIMAICLASFPIPGSLSRHNVFQASAIFQASGIEGRVYQLSGNQMPSPRRHGPPPGFPSAADSTSVADSHSAGNSPSMADSHSAANSPSVASPTPKSKGTGVAGTVCVFELTNDTQVVRQGTSLYCQTVHTRLIRQANTDDKGNFSILLPPGTYSVFTKKGDLFYATRRDEKNNIAPVEVLPGKMTRVDCRVESAHNVIY